MYSNTELHSMIDANINLQQDKVKLLADRRLREAQAKGVVEKKIMAFGKVEERMTALAGNLSIGIAARQDYKDDVSLRDFDDEEAVDSWGQAVMDRYLRRDTQFMEIYGEYYDAQEAVSDARLELHVLGAEVTSLAEELGSLKNRGLMIVSYVEAVLP